jgi:V/A-type H+-transporting ATPase subunit D
LIKFQYNKTSLGDMDRQLKVRVRALPTIKSKESALRLEVKKARDAAAEYSARLEKMQADQSRMEALWGEFDPQLLRVADVKFAVTKVAGVRIPQLDEIVFEEKPYDLFGSPMWLTDGVELLKKIASVGLEREFYVRRAELLDHARRKTTQKVNLYEKVQIPGYEEAILKIKRFLEDEENLSKAAQKIVKTRHENQEDGA